MSLENFAKKVSEILEKGDNATLPELQKAVFKGLEKEYNNLKKGQLTIVLQHLKGKNEYNLYPHDPLLMLKFKHRIKSKLDKKAIEKMDNAKIFMHLPDGKMIEVAEINTFEQLEKIHGEPSYFSFEVKNIEEITTKIQAKVRGNIVRNEKKTRQNEESNGDCEGKNDIGKKKKQCPAVDKRIKGRQMSNKARKSICNSYANCNWEENVVDQTMVGGRKKKRRKKKKAFPSRKKTHRKNSTKKRARK